MRLARLGALPISLLAVGATLREDALVFRPEAGASVEKTFEVGFHVVADEIRVAIGDRAFGEWTQDPDLELTSIEKILIEDSWVALAEGRPTQLRRTLWELDGTWTNSQGEEVELESWLEGKDVLFTWDAESGEYDVAYEDDGDPELLKGLVADLDLCGFLPPVEVTTGDTWPVPVAAWKALVSPGGDLHFESEQLLPDRALLRRIQTAWTGKLQAEFEGFREIDGVELAVVAVTGLVQSQNEIDVESESQLGVGLEGERFVCRTRSLDLSVDVELELRWDPVRGHLHSLSMTGGVRAVHVSAGRWHSGSRWPGDLDLAIEVRLSGTATITAAFERP